MRGSIDRCPGSKLAVNGASHTNAKKFNRVQTIEQRKNATSQKLIWIPMKLEVGYFSAIDRAHVV